MYSRSIFAGAAVLAFIIPTFVSAVELKGNAPPTRDRPLAAVGATWFGYAVSPNRRIFRSPGLGDEVSARSNAKTECETTSLRTCSVIAVPEGTDVSAVGCTHNGRSESFVGGSNQSHQRQIAFNKARAQSFPASSCVEFFSE